ncbi:hypothetical protein ACFO0N_06765 [Halobium salinum]|uniref:Uncharacterized protein n=1 Tax=Halobium salinum TaxID=1364940 RepID=A0ABD5PB19_9EURY|nr:hypothetical protein [Halobium salinum]
MGDDTRFELTDTRKRPVFAGTPLSGLFKWLLLSGNRWYVALALAGGFFLLTMGVGLYGPVSVSRFVGRGVSPSAALIELLKSIVSIVTIILSINQLVLSPKFGSVGDQRDALQDSMQLRERAERVIDARVSALSPAAFLHDALDAVAERADELTDPPVDAVNEPDRDALRRDLTSYAADVRDDAESIRDELADAEFGGFEAIPAAIRFDVSRKVQQARLLRRTHADAIDAETDGRLDGLVERLELFAVAREFFKTTFIGSEYIAFSRGLLFVSVPSLLVALYAMLIYDPGAFAGTTLGVDDGLWFVTAAFTVSLLPLAVLVSFVARLATLSQSTLFVGPFAAGAADRRERSDGD